MCPTCIQEQLLKFTVENSTPNSHDNMFRVDIYLYAHAELVSPFEILWIITSFVFKLRTIFPAKTSQIHNTTKMHLHLKMHFQWKLWSFVLNSSSNLQNEKKMYIILLTVQNTTKACKQIFVLVPKDVNIIPVVRKRVNCTQVVKTSNNTKSVFYQITWEKCTSALKNSCLQSSLIHVKYWAN